MGQNVVRRLRADHGDEILARRAADARQAAERDEQRLAPPRPDAGDLVEIGPEVALRPRLPMERDRETVGLVADPLDEEQRRAGRGERDRLRRGRA